MNTFVQNFIQNQKSKVLTSAKGVVTNQFAKINEALTRYKQELLESNPRYDSLISALTQDPTFISDQMVSEGRRYVENCLSPAEIGEEDAMNLFHGVKDAITNNETNNEYGLTITDAKGYCYNFINQCDYDDIPLDLDGYKIYLSSSLVPSSLGEAILYKDLQGKFHLNNVIRTANFVKRAATLEPGSTVFDKVVTCCFVKKTVIPGDIFSGLLALLNNSTGIHTVSHAIEQWAIENNHSFTGSTIYDMIDEMEQFYINYWSAIGEGSFSSIWSVFSDLIESSTLNSAILSTIQAVQSFNGFSIDFFTTLKDKIGSKYNSVREFFSGARDAFMRGGFTGLGTYILSYVKALSSLVDKDGLIAFTDNKDLVPQQYIAGVVFQIISAVITVVGVIVSIFSKIIGIAITVLGGIFGLIAQVFTADANQQYAAMQMDDNVIYPIAPYALFQQKVDTYALNASIISLLKNGAELVAQEVPGGYIIIGPCSVDKDKVDSNLYEYWDKYPECMMKFYPSVVPHNKYAILREFLTAIDNNDPIFSYDEWSADDPFEIKFNKDCVRNFLLANDYSADIICQIYNDAAEDVEYTNEDDGRLKNADQIATLTQSIVQNITWFILWAISERGAMSDWVSKDIAIPYNNVKACFYTDSLDFAYCWTIPYCCSDDHLYHFQDGVHTIETFYDGTTFWKELGEYAVGASKWPSVKINENAKPYEIRALINRKHAIDEALETPARLSFMFLVPKYDPDTFWFWVVFSAIVMVAVTVIAVVTTLKVKKAITRKRATNQANVEAAWEQLKGNPSKENYDNYRKVVKKNNRWANLIGGTKYDYVNYWNGDVSGSSDGSTSGNILSGLDEGQSSLEPVADSTSVMTDNDILIIKKLITG